MDSVPVDANGLFSKVAEQGALFAFMMFVILALAYVAKTLYERNIKQGDDNTQALIDSTVAISNNTTALNILTKEIERLNDAR